MIFIDGFERDVNKVKKAFLKTDGYDFQQFKKIYKDIKFSLIFSGFATLAECLEFTEQVILYSKNMWLESSDFKDQVFGLYMTSALCYTQPFQDGAYVRLVVRKDEEKITTFLEKAQDLNCKEAIFIFHKLIVDGMVEICWTPFQYAMEKSHRKYFPNKWRCLRNTRNDYNLHEIKSLAHYGEGGIKDVDEKMKELTRWREVWNDVTESDTGMSLNCDLKQELAKTFSCIKKTSAPAPALKTSRGGRRGRRPKNQPKIEPPLKNYSKQVQQDPLFEWFNKDLGKGYESELNTGLNPNSELLFQTTDLDELFLHREIKHENGNPLGEEGVDDVICFNRAQDSELQQPDIVFVGKVENRDSYEEYTNAENNSENADMATFTVLQDVFNYMLNE